MTFFKRKRKVNQLYVVKTEIISSYDDGTGWGPRVIIQFFLACKRNNKYYELFSGERLELETDTHNDGCIFKNMNVPYIVEAKSIKDYSNAKKFKDSELFYFITKMNVLNTLGAFDEDDDNEDEEFEEEVSDEE